MTGAAFLLACERCHENQGLVSGVVESFICWRCAADKIFPVTARAAVASIPPTVPPAGPVLTIACQSCGRTKPWRNQRPPWLGAVCYDCFRAGRGTSGGPRT